MAAKKNFKNPIEPTNNEDPGPQEENSGSGDTPRITKKVASDIRAHVRHATSADGEVLEARAVARNRFVDGALHWVQAGLLLAKFKGQHGIKRAAQITDKQADIAYGYARAWVRAGSPGGEMNPRLPETWRSKAQVLELGRLEPRPPQPTKPMPDGTSAAPKVPPQGGTPDAASLVRGIAMQALAQAKDPHLDAGKLMHEIVALLPNRPARVQVPSTPSPGGPPSVTLLLGDVLEMLERAADGSIPCCVTSPPYWRMRKFGGGPKEMGREATPEAHLAALLKVFGLLRRKMSDRGTLFLNYNEPSNADGSLIGLPERLVIGLLEQGWCLRERIMWAKTSRSPNGGAIQRITEPLYVFTVSPKVRLDWTHEIHHTGLAKSGLREIVNHTKSGRHNGRRARSCGRLDLGARPTTLWLISSETHVDHEAPYPVELAERCVLAGSHPGDLVCDPFIGSGTTAMAAVKHGRSVLGIDLVAKNIRLSKDRIASIGVPYELMKDRAAAEADTHVGAVPDDAGNPIEGDAHVAPAEPVGDVAANEAEVQVAATERLLTPKK